MKYQHAVNALTIARRVAESNAKTCRAFGTAEAARAQAALAAEYGEAIEALKAAGVRHTSACGGLAHPPVAEKPADEVKA